MYMYVHIYVLPELSRGTDDNWELLEPCTDSAAAYRGFTYALSLRMAQLWKEVCEKQILGGLLRDFKFYYLFHVFHLMASGRVWRHSKFAYGVWQSFTFNSEHFQKSP
jgi:hypothetical protein